MPCMPHGPKRQDDQLGKLHHGTYFRPSRRAPQEPGLGSGNLLRMIVGRRLAGLLDFLICLRDLRRRPAEAY